MSTQETYSHTLVRRFLDEIGYSEADIREGFEWAETQRWEDADELGELALSRILLDNGELERGVRIGWEPVDWSAYEDPDEAA